MLCILMHFDNVMSLFSRRIFKDCISIKDFLEADFANCVVMGCRLRSCLSLFMNFFKLMTLGAGSGPDSKSKYKRSRGRDNGAGIIGKRKRKRVFSLVKIAS